MVKMANAVVAVIALLGLVTLAGPAVAQEKPTIVLIHGAFETADVWKAVERQLRADGFRTIAANLPGRPGNPLPAKDATLALYRDAVIAAIGKEKRPVILVGHSFGGMTISNVASAVPARIRTLVYVAAYLPKNGDTLLSLSLPDGDSKMGPSFRVSADKTAASVDPATRGGLFCNGCAPDIAAAVAAGMIDEPLAPTGTPIALTPAFAAVDKVYIHTMRDIVVSPKLQAAMVAATPVRKELSVNTGHAPFAAAPVELARAIEAAIR